jgi:hypothetical protein
VTRMTKDSPAQQEAAAQVAADRQDDEQADRINYGQVNLNAGDTAAQGPIVRGDGGW